jgi:hypothetical protein
LDDHPFGKDDLISLGLEAGGMYETIVVVDRDDGFLAKPLGLRVTSCGLFVTIYLPSRSFRDIGIGHRFFVSLPSIDDAALFSMALTGTPIQNAAMYSFERSEHPRHPDLPGLLVEVSAVEEGMISDDRGETHVRYFLLKPLQSLVPAGRWSPFCRAFAQLVEAAILLTRDDLEGAAGLLEQAKGTAPYKLQATIELMENLI